ncbi:lysine N(6)-hydroxylase/L-ornithine N(5)-oxygenase family protein [Halalkalibacter nanhaiisediminis]|uniref:L-lysine N6-monooxygenase MbtG n=1 Tax=Halalkalibacter nanhaiisediminis TaxID=688079 RepID=A0A562QCF8_9BACI|nr:SidA/IucD/PvdA family monooxygenase [Halalkalibacter nanhaiisediminis]TWI54457.1 lysine N6-hydroxylase [Halalkalibacter nanhaiisediminis]
MNDWEQYDVVGIGIGPFNLGLAALAEEGTSLKTAFFDKTQVFQWHPGMLLERSDLQVPFLADLVTFANPMSHYTFLNYIHQQNRMFQFYFFKRFDIPRREYSDYCAWVASQLDNCHFGQEVVDCTYEPEHGGYAVSIKDVQSGEEKKVMTTHIILGTGSSPLIPPPLEEKLNEDVIHTSRYLHHADEIKEARSVTVIGSGQSAAEVFYDLLEKQADNRFELTWLTRSPGFFQLESGKLGQEVFSPDYVDYFHKLSFEQRQEALPTLGGLRNGVEAETLRNIYDLLYHRTIRHDGLPVRIQAMTEVNDIQPVDEQFYKLSCKQWQQEKEFTHTSEKVILATGYKPLIPSWLMNMSEELEWEDEKRFRVSHDYRLEWKEQRPHHFFTLTNLEHSHGASATNLALSVQRNQAILNTIVGEDVYPVRSDTIFQQFEVE